MNALQAPTRLLDALKMHEREIARLYEVYAELFPSYHRFWTELSAEEIEHANWIERLEKRIEQGSEDFLVERFPLEAIERCIAYVRELVDRAHEPGYQLINALSEALHLEEALSESRFFEILEGDSAETKRTLILLAKATRAHHQKIREAWQQNR